jgi:Helix-turn-helix domain
MINLTRRDSGVNPGPDRGAPSRTRSLDREPLRGLARRAFERGLLRRPGLKGSRRFLLQVLLIDYAWGKADCYPGNETLAAATGLSISTIKRALHDLEQMGIIRLVEDLRLASRRRIVFVDHPHAQQVLDGLAAAAAGTPSPPRDTGSKRPGRGVQIEPAEGFNLTPESVRSLSSQDETPPNPQGGLEEISLGGSNGRTDSPLMAESGQPTPGSTPAPVEPDLHAEVPTEASEACPSPFVPPPPRPVGARRAGLVDWSSAPSDDPVIAAELARRAAARQAAAPAPTMAEILAAVLSPSEPSQDATAAAVDVPAGVDGPPMPGGVPGAAPVPVDDAEVIRALSQIGPGATAKEIQLATLRLTRLFQDAKSLRYYAGVVRAVSRGELPARIPIAAVERSQGPGVLRPAAVFTSYIERCRAVREARSKRPDG